MYNEKRLNDVNSLVDYAIYLNHVSSFSGDAGSKIMNRVFQSIFFKNTIDQMLFGPNSAPVPYSVIVDEWKAQLRIVEPISKFICYPICAVADAFIYAFNAFGFKKE
jgi:hypothetical protein